eukprot:699755_1
MYFAHAVKCRGVLLFMILVFVVTELSIYHVGVVRSPTTIIKHTQQNKQTFYILEYDKINQSLHVQFMNQSPNSLYFRYMYKDCRKCSSQRSREVYQNLYNHSQRTVNITEAAIVIPNWHYIASNGRDWAEDPSTCYQPRINNAERMDLYARSIQIFHELKTQMLINKDAWLLLFIFQMDVFTFNFSSYDDVSVCHHGTALYNNYRAWIDIPFATPDSYKWDQKQMHIHSQFNVNCLSKDKLVFFQGRTHGSIFPSQHQILINGTKSKCTFIHSSMSTVCQKISWYSFKAGLMDTNLIIL